MPRFRHPRHIDLFVLEHGRKALHELVITNNLDEHSLEAFQEWLTPQSRWARLGTYALSLGVCAALLGGAVWAAAMTVPLPLSRGAAKTTSAAPSCEAGFTASDQGRGAGCAPARQVGDPG